MVKQAKDPCLIVIASADHNLGTKWLRTLQKQFAVHVVNDGRYLERAISTLKPMVLILDHALLSLLPGSGGLTEPMRRLINATRTIIISNHIDEKEGVSLLKAGARGYCIDDPGPQIISKAVDAVLRGEVWVGRKVIQLLLDELAGFTEHLQREFQTNSDEQLKHLTPRQREIVSLISRGASNKEIAHALHVSEKTVKAHLTGIFRKLKLTDRLQLALFVTQPGASRTPVQGTKVPK
ncbi:MAG TPA: response regulator transcription factor [Nitrospiraceae bacterium]|jgi:DNA-binding NarL/FixJ family response regulator|nr:response regulator transcription factor [Nitrospiraceae bacterium]